jgi:hypothetical protein
MATGKHTEPADTKTDEVVDTFVGRPSKATPLQAGDPVEQEAVTGRPNDIPIDKPQPPAGGGSTFASRRAAREVSEKRIASAQNKAVKPQQASTKKS